MHTLLIKGINPNISTDKAERGIGKVFTLRFGKANILKIQLFRPTQNIRQLIKARSQFKKKLNKAKKLNKESGETRVMATIPQGMFKQPLVVDSEIYY